MARDCMHSLFNYLDVLVADIQNVYLNAYAKENIFIYAADEWKSNKGIMVIITKVLYGLNSSALMWGNNLSDIIGNKLGFKSSLSDPNLWFKPKITDGGFKYYSYILVCVDGILIIDKDPDKYMSML